MDFVCKLYGITYAVHVTVALVDVATLNLALPPPPPRPPNNTAQHQKRLKLGLKNYHLVYLISLKNVLKMTLFCSFLFVIVFFQYLSQHLAINNSKIPWINWFLTFSFFPTPQAVWNHCKILPEVADGFSGGASGKSSRLTPFKCLPICLLRS